MIENTSADWRGMTSEGSRFLSGMRPSSLKKASVGLGGSRKKHANIALSKNLNALAILGGEVLSQFRYETSMNQSALLSNSQQLLSSQISSIKTLKSMLSTSQASMMLSFNRSFKNINVHHPQEEPRKKRSRLFNL